MISLVVDKLDLPSTWRIYLSCLSCLKPEKVPPVREFEREGRPPSPIVVDGEEECELEAILRHNRKGAQRAYI